MPHSSEPFPVDKVPDGSPLLSLDVLQRFRIVFRAAQQHSARTESRLGISGANAWVLAELREAGPLRAGDLAAKLAIKPATLSNMLARLVASDLVTRVRSEQDLRVVLVALSDKGRELIDSVDVAPKGWLPEALSRLDETQLAHLAEGLDSLLDIMEVSDRDAADKPLPFTE